MTVRIDAYWCATDDTDELLDNLHGKIKDYYQDLRDTGLKYVYERSFRAYHGARLTSNALEGGLFDSVSLHQAGKVGEITQLKSNQYRNFVQHSLNLTTSQKPAFHARATNSDYKSQAQSILADGLLDYYLREKQLTGVFVKTVENALLFGEGSVTATWNPSGGEIYDYTETGAEIREGDIEYTVNTPLDVIRDFTVDNNSPHDWLITRSFGNRWTLAAKYPEVSEEILASTAELDIDQDLEFSIRPSRKKSSSDRIPVWTLFHRDTPAMPGGRLVIFTSGAILFDGPIPYDDIPVFFVQPASIEGTPYGYSPMWDLLAPQQALDILTSTIMSNQASGGLNNIWTKAGGNMSIHNLEGGLRHIQSEDMPQSIAFARTPAEIFNFRQQVIGEMEILSGISSTVRGNPEANLKSGAALALVVSQSIQFASVLESGYNRLVEGVGTELIRQLKTFSQTPRVAALIGEADRPFMREFVASEDLSNITRITVEQVSPLSKTISGRVEIANSLLEKGFIETPQQYMMVLQTGRLDAMTTGTTHELLNIKAENEALRNGEDVSVIVTENHEIHVREHKTLLASPEAKQDAELVARVLAHIQEHLDQWRNADPMILQITGQNPPLPAAPAQPPVDPGMLASDNPAAPMGDMPNMPNMPNMPQGSPPEAIAAFESANLQPPPNPGQF